MKKRKQKSLNNASIPKPFSMETLNDYIARVDRHSDTIELFPDSIQRRNLAITTFNDKWENALVTVTKTDGTRFFID